MEFCHSFPFVTFVVYPGGQRFFPLFEGEEIERRSRESAASLLTHNFTSLFTLLAAGKPEKTSGIQGICSADCRSIY